MKDFYKVLGFKFSDRNNISHTQINERYRKLAFEHHPDKAKANDKNNNVILELNEAYEILKDKDKRAKYDQSFANLQNNQETLKLLAYQLLTESLNQFKLYFYMLKNKVAIKKILGITLGIDGLVFKKLEDTIQKLKDIKLELETITRRFEYNLILHINDLMKEVLFGLKNKNTNDSMHTSMTSNYQLLNNDTSSSTLMNSNFDQGQQFFNETTKGQFPNSEQEKSKDLKTIIISLNLVSSMIRELENEELIDITTRLTQIVSKLSELPDIIEKELDYAKRIIKNSRSKKPNQNTQQSNSFSMLMFNSLNSPFTNQTALLIQLFALFSYGTSFYYAAEDLFNTEHIIEKNSENQNKIGHMFKHKNSRTKFFIQPQEYKSSLRKKIASELEELNSIYSSLSQPNSRVTSQLINRYNVLIAAFPEEFKEHIKLTEHAPMDWAIEVVGCAIEEKNIQLEYLEAYDDVKDELSRMLPVP